MSRNQRAICLIVTLLVVMALLGAGCIPFPQDPRNSLNQAQARGSLRVGALASPPWVTGEPPGVPGGVEAALVTAFADELGVAVDWHWGSADELFMALTHYELDLLIGGITESNPWQSEVAFTIPYYTSHALVGVSPTEPLLTDLDDVVVTVRQGSELAAQVKDQGGVVVAAETLTGVDSPVAAEAWEIRGLGFRPTTIQLTSYNHVMATPQGENALLMQLEDFLLQQTADADLGSRLWEVAIQ